MLPFLCLLVLCGLLAQNAQGNGSPLAIANFSPEMLHQLISQRMNSQDFTDHLQRLPLEGVIKNGMRQSSGGGFLSGIPLLGGLVNKVVVGLLGVKIKKVSLLELDVKLDKDETRLIITIPADIELEVKCPLHLAVKLVHLKLYLDVQVGVRLVKDPYTGHIKLTIENCQNNPGHLRVTVLENVNPLFQLVNKVVRLVTDIVEKTVPHLLQKELCPLANGLVQSVLDLLQGSFTSQMHNERFQLTPESFRLHDGSLQMVYGGNVPMPEGHSISAPLPSVSRGDSRLNMALSHNYVASMLETLLPAQTLTLGSQGKDPPFRQEIAAVLPRAHDVQALQIRTGTLSLSLAVGRIQVRLPIEIRAYRENPVGAYGPLFVIRINLVLLAHPSVSGGKLILSLHTPSIESISLLSSSIGNFDAQHLTGMLTRVMSTYLVPYVNRILAEGIPIPLVHNLGVDSMQVVAGKDALFLVVQRGMAPVSA
ncbi:BPI fold-containing family B member 1-like [Paroedura picta]|uniref:BPI fold-containing family B member 1-like n=1 Tax=Paroedura picta TaxID=143630 RepID=UPI004055DDB2